MNVEEWNGDKGSVSMTESTHQVGSHPGVGFSVEGFTGRTIGVCEFAGS